MPAYPPSNGAAALNVFSVAYWTALSNALPNNAAPLVNAHNFWADHPEAAAVGRWDGNLGIMEVLHAIDATLLDPPGEPLMYCYKTRDAQSLQNIHDWYNEGGLNAFRRYVRQQLFNGKSNAAIGQDMATNVEAPMIGPLAGHIGSLHGIQANMQGGTAILKFTMRKGAYGVLFGTDGRAAFSTAGRTLQYAARYLRHAQQSTVHKRTGEAGEAYLAGWLGVKGEDHYYSFAIGDNSKSQALFQILVGKCDWEVPPPNPQTLERPFLNKW
jgi:hypothetical protein